PDPIEWLRNDRRGAVLIDWRSARCELADLQLHQPFGSKTNHVAQQIAVGGFLHERAQVHHFVGRWSLGCRLMSRPNPNPEIAGDLRRGRVARRRQTPRRSRRRGPPATYTTPRGTTLAHGLARMESARPAALPTERWCAAQTVLRNLTEAGTVADAPGLGW